MAYCSVRVRSTLGHTWMPTAAAQSPPRPGLCPSLAHFTCYTTYNKTLAACYSFCKSSFMDFQMRETIQLIISCIQLCNYIYIAMYSYSTVHIKLQTAIQSYTQLYKAIQIYVQLYTTIQLHIFMYNYSPIYTTIQLYVYVNIYTII